MRSNIAGDGGGLYVHRGDSTLMGNTFESNTGTAIGSDIYNSGGTVIVNGCGAGAYGSIGSGTFLDTGGVIGGDPFSYSCAECER